MAVRICTLGLSIFRIGGKGEGIEINSRWSPIEATAHASVIAGVRDFHGRYVRVHPDDRKHLAEIGLAFVAEDKPLALAKKSDKQTNEPNPEAVGGKTDATKTSGKTASKDR